MTAEISIEVVFAAKDKQRLVELSLLSGATVEDAIAASRLVESFPEHALNALPVGIWGRMVEKGQALEDGDRVEIYRELLVDPMQARRIKASVPDPGPHESR